MRNNRVLGRTTKTHYPTSKTLLREPVMAVGGMAATRALLIGKSSFLARGILSQENRELSVDALSHTADLASIDLDSYDVVVNTAYDPSYMMHPYREEADFDLKVAKHVERCRAHYVMLSTRRVYGPAAPFRITERCRPMPDGHYGRNKLRTETAIQSMLGSRCTILRVGNVFGFELGRRSFFGIALRTLKESNRIVLDVSPFVSRDFVHLGDFATLLRRTLVHRPQGVYNLGTGCATAVGRIALSIIEGYQSGDLLVTSPVERDSFELDVMKLSSCIGSLDSVIDVHTRCVEIGRKLKDA